MKRYILACITLLLVTSGFYSDSRLSSLNGAWITESDSPNAVLIIQDGYLSITNFEKPSKKFYGTRGGSFKTDNNKLVLQTEFNSESKEKVGTAINYTFSLKDDKLILTHEGKEEKWKRIDDNRGDLAGTWRISARMQGEKMNPINPGPRKTLKILSGTRFQWMAINTETKEFFGTGGGQYTFKDGKYTENIEFFSRDSSRVGASLTFDGKVENNVWTHKGMNSRGEPLHEEWTKE